MDDLIICLKALSDNTRMSIVELLLRFNFCAGALARRLDISEAAVSQHIKVLRDAKILTGEKHGYFMNYRINTDKLVEISEYLDGITGIKRLPCDPTFENCPAKKRCLCHSEKRCKGCDCCNDCRNCHRVVEELEQESAA